MRHLTEKKLMLVFIAGCLIFLFYGHSPVPTGENVPETASSPETEKSFTDPPPRSRSRVVYMCRLGKEEIPAVQIFEVKNEDGAITGTIARVRKQSVIEVKVPGAAPVWDYKSVAARTGEQSVEVAFDEGGKNEGDDWILTLEDENVYLRERVRDCLEVSDE